MRVAIVGVCASGKTELAKRLSARGLEAHCVAQEHSYVSELWRHEAFPEVLVYLEASLRAVRRRGRRGMVAGELREQRRRLAGARRHADMRVPTDHLCPAEVEAIVLRRLAGRQAAILRCSSQ